MRIKELDIVSFRGIPDQLHIDFPIKNNKPSSLIIVGDNGVGKSSIVDAVEFCLQGHIAQNKKLTNSHSASLVSLRSKRKPNITIKFENAEVMNRKILNDEQGLLSNVKNPHRAFSISPFVIRRHDILRFINTSEAERTLVFGNYLRNELNSEWVEHPEDELKRRLSDRFAAKKERDNLIKELASSLKIDASKIPFERKEFYEFVKDKIYNGLPKSQFESLGYRVKLNVKAEKLAEKVYEAIENHRKTKSAIGSFSISSQTTFPKHLYSQLEDFLMKASEKLTKSFLEISPLKFIDKIEIVYENDSVVALTVNIVLTNGKKCNPNQILSEANLDLLALLFFMAFIEESAERGQSKFLILDDVLQSIDATIRVSFMSYLLKKFNDWQFIITVHDRLWQRQLTELFILNGQMFSNVTIAGWSFEDGPIIKNLPLNYIDDLKLALNKKILLNICSISGLVLEEMSDILSVNLSTSIIRRKDDRYTLGDLFPGISKILKKTEIRPIIEEVEKWLHLRNLIGAHFNEWALSLSLEEAVNFGEAVLKFYEKLKCQGCSSWIINNPSLLFYTCRCGLITIKK